MNRKRIVGLILLILGIIAVIYANHQKGRVARAKQDIHEGSNVFSIGGNSVAEGVGSKIEGSLQAKASQYDAPLMWIQIGGIVVGVIGIGMLFCGCKKR